MKQASHIQYDWEWGFINRKQGKKNREGKKKIISCVCVSSSHV